MKVAVVGSRSFEDYALLKKTLDELYPNITLIVSGGARGADSLSEQYAKEEGIRTLIFKPDWEKHGRAAGFIRNRDIVENSDHVVAFWDGKSRGTKNSMDLATKLGKTLKTVLFTPVLPSRESCQNPVRGVCTVPNTSDTKKTPHSHCRSETTLSTS